MSRDNDDKKKYANGSRSNITVDIDSVTKYAELAKQKDKKK